MPGQKRSRLLRKHADQGRKTATLGKTLREKIRVAEHERDEELRAARTEATKKLAEVAAEAAGKRAAIWARYDERRGMIVANHDAVGVEVA